MKGFKPNKNSVLSVALCENKKYEAFGNLKWSSGTYSDNREFTSKEKDPTGFHYFGARYYSGDIGRFLSPDPHSLMPGNLKLYNPQTLNPYVYCHNDPLNYFDPSGLEEEEIIRRRNFFVILWDAFVDAVSSSGPVRGPEAAKRGIDAIQSSDEQFREETKQLGEEIPKYQDPKELRNRFQQNNSQSKADNRSDTNDSGTQKNEGQNKEGRSSWQKVKDSFNRGKEAAKENIEEGIKDVYDIDEKTPQDYYAPNPLGD